MTVVSMFMFFQTLIYAWIDTLLTPSHLPHFEITTILCCSKGSVVVKYELAVKKTAASSTLNTIVDTVNEASENGTFGNFTIDPASIKAESELCNISDDLSWLFAPMLIDNPVFMTVIYFHPDDVLF